MEVYICEAAITMVDHGNYAGNGRNEDIRRVREREKVVGSIDGGPSRVKEL